MHRGGEWLRACVRASLEVRARSCITLLTRCPHICIMACTFDTDYRVRSGGVANSVNTRCNDASDGVHGMQTRSRNACADRFELRVETGGCGRDGDACCFACIVSDLRTRMSHASLFKMLHAVCAHTATSVCSTDSTIHPYTCCMYMCAFGRAC